jgi:sulfatase maturation enzyme AslB (radical SAM superfamily)
LNLNVEQEKVWHLKQIDQQPSVKFLTEQIDNAERIYFAGGEPLMMEEHWHILELLIERKKFSVALTYNTNASVIHYNKKNVLDYWSQWNKNKIIVMSSIDEIGERAELIRSGTVWSKVEQNLISMLQLDTIIVKPSITVSAMNVARLPEIVGHLASIGVIKRNNFNVNVVFAPEYYHVSILPEHVRREISEKIERFVTRFSSEQKVDVAPVFKYVLHELKRPTNTGARDRFVSFTEKLDTIRNEDIYSVIPELKCLL